MSGRGTATRRAAVVKRRDRSHSEKGMGLHKHAVIRANGASVAKFGWPGQCCTAQQLDARPGFCCSSHGERMRDSHCKLCGQVGRDEERLAGLGMGRPKQSGQHSKARGLGRAGNDRRSQSKHRAPTTSPRALTGTVGSTCTARRAGEGSSARTPRAAQCRQTWSGPPTHPPPFFRPLQHRGGAPRLPHLALGVLPKEHGLHPVVHLVSLRERTQQCKAN